MPHARGSATQRPGPWSPRGTVLAVAVLLLAVGAVLVSGLPVAARQLVSGLGLVGGGLWLGAGCLHRFRLSAGRRRSAWLMFALASLSAAGGNAWILASVLAGRPERSFAGEAALGIALLLVAAGLVVFPSLPRRGIDLARMVLDGVVLGGSVLLIVGDTVLPQVLEQTSAGVAERVTSLLAPVVDLVLATVAWLLFLRGTRGDRPALAAAAGGFGLFAASDIASAVQRSAEPLMFGTVTDLGWIAGYALIGLGVRSHPARTAPTGQALRERSGPAGTLVMFGMLVVAAALHLLGTNAADSSAVSGVLLVIVLVAVAARQVLLLLDNERLRRDLEQRVIERSTELREVTQRSDLLVDSVGDGVYGVDSEGSVTFVNPAAVQVLGYRPRELLGRNAHSTFHAHRTDGRPYPLASCYVTEAVRDGVAVHSEDDTYVDREGRLVPVEVTASPLAKDASVRGAVVVFRDVTHRREVDRLKNEFVSMVSHELKTPLTAIRGSLGLLAGGALGELSGSAKRMVEIAMDSSERLTRLINQILDMERIESGDMPMEISDQPAAVVVASAIDQVQVLANQAQVRVCTGALDGVVRADPDRVVQTLLNLLGNAVKFSPPGSQVVVQTSVGDSVVTFRITDRGRGVPDDMLDSIFSRFQQVDSSDAREKGGSGLGLAISRSIVERLGGRIWAENNPEGGATFSFTLPAAEVGTDVGVEVEGVEMDSDADGGSGAAGPDPGVKARSRSGRPTPSAATRPRSADLVT